MSNANEYLNQLNNTVNTFTSNVDVKVNAVNQASEELKSNADKAYQEITKFKTEMIENEQMQNAHENILRINQIIKEQFYDYDDIRKTVMGVIMDFDMNLVRNKTITELSEELWITSSRYWLSYTLIALSAWASNNKNVAITAMSESYRVDKAKTSLFFCLMNMRFNRVEAARKWVCEYFSIIDPNDVKDETAIILQAYINGLFGTDKEIEYTVNEVVEGWIRQIGIDETNSFALKEMYLNYIDNIYSEANFKNDYLSKYCSVCEDLEPSYQEAMKYDTLINKIDSLDVENIILNASDYKARVDKILRDLITNYDQEELELKEQQEYFNLIIKNNGKKEIAEKQFLAILDSRNKKQDIGEKCIEWALYNDRDVVDEHVSKFGLQHTKTWLLDALNSWSKDYEEQFVEEYPIKIDNWDCVSNGEDAQEQEIKLVEHLENNKFKIKYVNKFNLILIILALVGLLIGVTTAVGVFSFIELQAIPYAIGFGIMGISLLVLLIRCLTATKRFNKKVNSQVNILRNIMTELTEYRRVYFENREKKSVLYSKIEQL